MLMTMQKESTNRDPEQLILNYLHNSAGGARDGAAAARYSCAVRAELARAAGSSVQPAGSSVRPAVAEFVRAGSDWLRNPEFGRVVADPRRRGRGNGRLRVSTPHNPHSYARSQRDVRVRAHSLTDSLTN